MDCLDCEALVMRFCKIANGMEVYPLGSCPWLLWWVGFPRSRAEAGIPVHVIIRDRACRRGARGAGAGRGGSAGETSPTPQSQSGLWSSNCITELVLPCNWAGLLCACHSSTGWDGTAGALAVSHQLPTLLAAGDVAPAGKGDLGPWDRAPAASSPSGTHLLPSHPRAARVSNPRS